MAKASASNKNLNSQVANNLKEKEIKLLDTWHPYVESALKRLHQKFAGNTKCILTESDLKCWLFYFLNLGENEIPFTVHTEVTHYAKYEGNTEKYKFRDLSLLDPTKVIANEEFLNDGVDKKDILSKGFSHKAPAIHFELKFVREDGKKNITAGLNEDIAKLDEYYPSSDCSIRDFVIVCGSRADGTILKNFTTVVESNMTNFTNELVKERLRFYLFDTKEIVCGKWVDNKIKFEIINP
jgi:hypothetical protein